MNVLLAEPMIGCEGGSSSLHPAAKQPQRILIVDDHRDCAISLCFVCRLWGHEAQCCFDGETAIRLITAFPPTVFLLDLAMPRMTGYDLAQRVRLQFLSGPLIVAVTGYTDEAFRRRSLACGFDDFFTKPLNLGLLEKLLHTHDLALPGAML